MPPPNTTPGTALSIALPFSATVDLTGVPNSTYTDCDASDPGAWYVYTARTNETVLNLVSPDGKISMWTGTPPTMTQQVNACGFVYAPIVVPGGTYYIQIQAAGITTLHVTEAANTSAPTGSLVVLNDVGDLDATVLNHATGATLQQRGLPPSEEAANFTTGEVCILAEIPGNETKAASVNIYSNQLSLVATVTSIIVANQVGLSPVTTNYTNKFYVCACDGTNPAIVKTLNSSGTVGGTTWTLPSNSIHMQGAAVTRNDATLYHSENIGGDGIIHSYNLGGSTPNADLIDFGASTSVGRDLLVLATSGDVLCVSNVGANLVVQRVTSGGAIAMTYTIGSGGSGSPRMCLAIDDPTSFWLMWFPSASPSKSLSRFIRIKVSDGSTVETFDRVNALGTNATSDYPAQSCPLWTIRGSALAPVSLTPFVPPPSGTTRYTRRVRTFNLPFDGNVQLFTSRLEFLVQSGVGLSTGQGSNPVLMVRFSTDGGHTFGNEIDLSYGAMGQYQWRAYINQLPRGRNLVCEVSTTDPVFVAWLACFADMDKGTS